MSQRAKLIVLRFSAMGDVAMVASVLREFMAQHPEVEVVMVSRSAFRAFFEDLRGLTFHAIEPKGKHKGFLGLWRLFKELGAYSPIAIADLHDNIRSRVLSTFFRLSGIKIRRIDKGRGEKKALTKAEKKVLVPLKSTVERYADVLRDLSYSFQLHNQLVRNPLPLPKAAEEWFSLPSKFVGISPFAQHIYKMYPLNQMEEVIHRLTDLGYRLFVFGGGEQEKAIAEQWSKNFSNVENLIGKFSLKEELSIISNLDIMLSMDSSGMHMASLMGVQVVSVWGPTHPYAGFLGYGQDMNDCLQIDHPARPNSIYGNKPCLCGDSPCIDQVSVESIVQRIKEKLSHG